MSKYRRKKVLFICIGNACRSPMAEAIARVDAYDAIDAFSAGLAPIGFVTELTKQTLISNVGWMGTSGRHIFFHPFFSEYAGQIPGFFLSLGRLQTDRLEKKFRKRSRDKICRFDGRGAKKYQKWDFRPRHSQ